MKSREDMWRDFVLAYDIEVSEDAVNNELEYIKLDMRHRMQYDRLTGGNAHLFPSQELAEQEEELRMLALFEAKEPKVQRRIIEQEGLVASKEELEAEALAMAKRQNTTIEAVKAFFGEDLAMLERDVLNKKVMDWALAQTDAS